MDPDLVSLFPAVFLQCCNTVSVFRLELCSDVLLVVYGFVWMLFEICWRVLNVC